MNTEIKTLSHALIEEIIGAFGLPKNAFFHRIFWPFFSVVTTRLACLGASFDRITREEGVPQAAKCMLQHFCSKVTVVGSENIPTKGPLLISSNHPGTVDGVVILSQLPRNDIVWLSGQIPFFANLPNASSHMLFVSKYDHASRIKALRQSIIHLRNGGALLDFGAGHFEPDPAFSSESQTMMDQWMEGAGFFLRHVPGLQIIPTIVSGVISPDWAHTRFRFLRKRQVDRLRIINFAQVIAQLISPGKYLVNPSVSFAPPFTLDDLKGLEPMSAVISKEKELLNEHTRLFGLSA
ncbi:MAG: hypothetical protein WA004_14875 [Saprospiraceae bacterium]